MTCDETRELLSELLDEALDTSERAQVEAHLAGCAECRRELDGLRATTGLLARVERARAPVGFVDRVMTQVPPAPWYRRLGRALFVPFSIKLPIEAGAMVVVALLGVYLLQTTPELQDAARREAPPASSPPATETPSAPVPAPPPARDREAQPKREVPRREREAEPKREVPKAEREAELKQEVPKAEREAEPKREYLQAPRPSSEDKTQQAAGDEAQKNVTSPAPPVAQEAPKAEVPAARSQMSRATEARESAPGPTDADRKGALHFAPAAPSILSAKKLMVPPVVSGVLTVTDRQRAEQSLAELIRKTGARAIGRREESTAIVVDVAVPQPTYAAFTRELATLGALRLEGQPTEIPPLVRLSVRISQ